MGLILKRCYLFVILSCITFSTLNIIGYLIIYEVYGYNGPLYAVQKGDLFFKRVVELYTHKEKILVSLVIITFIISFFVQIVRHKKKKTS
ncbi:hypothetical protein [Bacillus sp. Marseille-Q3570]|uniref:hypothetical protein n=1 Tax=Bacillus sp. Marseille-Q3570 TaxID=2963522 RepID=UPI0021B7C3AC|nr:hypothetical protein [Bacillus sp. Marseille-Q3570]